MPGNRSPENGNHITPRKYYRRNLTVAETDVNDASIPILDTRYYDVGYGEDSPSVYGIGQINLSILLGADINSVTIGLYLLSADEELKTDGGSSASSSSGAPTENSWVLAGTKTVSASTLWIVEGIPPGQYKALVTAIDGGGAVDLMTQHAA